MIAPTHLTAQRRQEHGASGLWAGRLMDSDFRRNAECWPNRLAIVDDRRSLTYSELAREVDRAASALGSLGIGRGDAVCWQLPNWIDAAVVHLAALRLGAVSSPIVPIYRHAEVGFILRQARAKVVIVPETFRRFNHAAMVAELRGGLPDLEHALVVGGAPGGGMLGWEGLLEQAATPCPPAERDPDDVVLLLYTSGTTSSPKGVLHTHNTIDYEIRSIVSLYGLTSGDRFFMPSPVTHLTGVLYGIHFAMALGTTLVLLDRWDATRALELLEEYQLTFMAGATPFLRGLVDHPRLREFRLALRTYPCGGADVPPDLVLRARQELGCDVMRMYGSTELSSLTSGHRGDPPENWAHTDGRLIADAQLRLVDSAGAPVPAGQAGEIEVYGPELFVGYLEATLNEAAFTPDGWFRTGDLGTLDRAGFLTITGRKKDIIIRGGENISAKEIEDLLAAHPAVLDVAAVGMPDPVLGERVCAFVVPRPGITPELADLVEFLRTRQIANQKLPERLELVDELPRTASGKVKKFVLRQVVAARP